MTLFEWGIDKERLIAPDAIKRIAEGYTAAPNEILLICDKDRRLIHELIAIQFAQLSSGTYFDFVPFEPHKYELAADLKPDFINQKKIQVNTTGNNSEFWGECYNLMFRAVHDYYHATMDLNFNYLEEISAYSNQVRHSVIMAKRNNLYDLINWPVYAKLLRSEIIYQAAYKTYYKEFHLPEQKIILSDL